MSKAISPNFREGLTAQNDLTGENEYLLSTAQALDVYVTGGGTSSATVVGIGPIGQYQVNYDTITYTNTSPTVDTYTYKAGGTGGTTTATVTITYTDSSKSQISTVVRT